MVGVEADFSDIEGFFKEETWNVQKKVIDIGEDAVIYAEQHGNYQDHTFNLRHSNDYNVDEDCSLELTNSAEYASYVESKGYDVLSGASLYAEKKLQEEFE